MQKFRFLLPLVILTLAVTAISFSLRSYRSSQTRDQAPVQSDSIPGTELAEPQSSESVGGEEVPGSMGTQAPSSSSQNSTATTPPQAEKKGFFAKIVDVFRPKSAVVFEEKKVSVRLNSEKDRPTAYTINIRYDPNVLTVEDVEQGDLWDRSTVLKRQVDNSSGKASFSVGQALGSQNSSKGTKIVTFSVKAKSTANLENDIGIDDSSKFAYVGLDYSVPLKSKSIKLEVE